ncbi:pantothenate synthetase [Desulfobotulus alkaliphilus]|uniref:Pantothenate synthetase n=1 Tax=Desulfobotulus alkaliphilus TaxID=622671 RepID=A0A562S2N5_9BACT|nr:pantoate--beta-alanine ligase [Desulfobotulus alkaliphilus]TWI75408.1 pantothenate synthetase [Desulfobotulus alkaliphilus]
MEIYTTPTGMQAQSLNWKRQGKRIGLVPTMGFLHEGHLSLMDIAAAHADLVVVSIFVNPTQFGPSEDLEAYPRNLERDLALCRERGVAAVFTPEPSDVYGPEYQSYVSLEKLPNHLCGLSRPVHFRGVATVVSKLFNIVLPDLAVFGEKDFQQLAVIRRLTADLNFPVRIMGGPIVREADGLAMSSRNAYLSPEERVSALCLSMALKHVASEVEKGERDVALLKASTEKIILSRPHTEIDYIAFCDPQTLEAVDSIGGPVLMALAVKVGSTRLIDNQVF